MGGGFIGILKRRLSDNSYYYKLVYKIFGITPRNIELYKLALVHKSASVILDDGSIINNERLEFLGDSVLGTVTSEMLFIEYPEKDEGVLSQLKARIISRATLNQLAVDLSIDNEIIAHASTINTQKQNAYGDAFEALVGALYLDKGYDHTNRIIIDRIFRRHLDIEGIIRTEQDFKSRIIEWAHKNHKNITFESTESAEHSDMNPSFVSVLTIGKEESGYGTGKSKKEAEQHASRQAYEAICGPKTA